MKLSILIITYNQEKFIGQTIESIISQDIKCTYEIIIGEDCSTDNTRKVIKDYCEKYPSIIKPIYNKENFGLLKNYYNSLSQCSGEYIMECSGDDYWLPGKVEVQLNFMEKNKDIGVCYGLAKQWLETKHRFANITFGKECEAFDTLLQSNQIPAPTVCYRNSLIQQYLKEIKPLEYDWGCEDYPEWLWFSKESKIKFIPVEFAVYRVIENSISHLTNVEKNIEYTLKNYNIKKFYCDRYGVNHNFDNEITKSIIEIYYISLLNNYNNETRVKLYEILKKNKTNANGFLFSLLKQRVLAFIVFKLINLLKRIKR